MTDNTLTWLADFTWTELERTAPAVPYWILVTGSVEQHGPHLPLGADTLVVKRLAQEAAKRHGAVILDCVNVGVLHAFQDWPGGLRVPQEVFAGQIEALAAHPARYSNRLLVLNGHDENHEPLLGACRAVVDRHHTDVVVVEWAQLVTDVIRDVSSSTSESHAGEALTSLFMHWYPERVRSAEVARGATTPGNLARDDLHVIKRAHHVTRYSRADIPSGVLGDPTRATANKGEIIATALVERVDELIKERGWQ
jgi:creatinine amidohydrolase/Fe(II)-dependent formamide hydrolase-like protein